MILAKPSLLNAPTLLYFALRGERLFLVDEIRPHRLDRFLRPGARLVRRLLGAFANVADVSTADRRLAVATWYFDSLLVGDLYSQLEPWQDRYYRFDEIDRTLPEYALCFRALVCSVRYDRNYDLFAWRCLCERFPDSNPRLVGFERDTRAAASSLADPAQSVGGRQGIAAGRFANAVVAAAAFVAGCLVLLRARWRGRTTKGEDVFLLADYIGDDADEAVYTCAGERGPVVLVERRAGLPRPQRTPPGSIVYAGRRDGILVPGEFGASFAEHAGDTLAMFRRLGWLGLREFFAAAQLPRKKFEARALLRRFRPKLFFARDGYNFDHVMRAGELVRIGALHYGINVGYPAYTILFPTSRYMRFDRYFGYGRDLYEKHYADRWPRNMKIVPAGSFRPSREGLPFRTPAPGADIAIFSGVMVPEPAMVRFVRDLAAAFPERTVRLQVKPVYLKRPEGRRFVEACTAGLPNVVPSLDSVYRILSEAGVSFSDPSSIVVEAMAMGVCSYLVDICGWHRSCYFRSHPEVVVRSGAEAAERLRALDAGPGTYPWDGLAEAADLSGIGFQDRFRSVLAEDFPCHSAQTSQLT